ncbi:MAG TPA: hypothetical protein VKJ65_13750, partial [Phycisphaerae bacterium]|nr:hypothetical protein [Phycisphaerae bacterium]
ELRPLLNMPDDDAWILIKAWLTYALYPNQPQPILVVNGEQGSAKSTLCEFLRDLIDPNKAMLRSLPKEERDIAISAKNGRVLAFDNLSGLPPALADALCRVSTGAGLATRKLYADDDEEIFAGTRPIIINGIDDLITRSDLADRAIVVNLPAIPEEKRQPMEALQRQFVQLRARLLGAILDALAAALKNLPNVQLQSLPRMADFARFAIAAEVALNIPPDGFLPAYRKNRQEADELALEASAIGTHILRLMQEFYYHEHHVTAGELLKQLEELAGGTEQARKIPGWPKTPRKLRSDLNRIAPNLRKLGIEFIPGGKGERGRELILRKRAETQSIPPVSSARASLKGTLPDGTDDTDGLSGTLRECGEADFWGGSL